MWEFPSGLRSFCGFIFPDHNEYRYFSWVISLRSHLCVSHEMDTTRLSILVGYGFIRMISHYILTEQLLEYYDENLASGTFTLVMFDICFVCFTVILILEVAMFRIYSYGACPQSRVLVIVADQNVLINELIIYKGHNL